jgi:hypothetical protein
MRHPQFWEVAMVLIKFHLLMANKEKKRQTANREKKGQTKTDGDRNGQTGSDKETDRQTKRQRNRETEI